MQQAALQKQLQTKQLETQILEQSVQAEILKHQLHQLQGQQGTSAPAQVEGRNMCLIRLGVTFKNKIRFIQCMVIACLNSC